MAGRLTIFFSLGGLIWLGCVGIVRLSPDLAMAITASEAGPVSLFVAVYMATGLAYLAILPLLRVLPGTPAVLLGILVLGLLMRLVMFGGEPILENDHHRYLWDGAVTVHTLNPYRYPPAAVRGPVAEADDPVAAEADVPPALRALAVRPEAARTRERIDHGGYTTIYPPVAQVGFAVAYLVRPFSVDAWRGVALACDLAVLAVLLPLLRRLHLSSAMVAVYWWCPLIVVELIQRVHMDAMLIPLVLGAMAAAVGGRAKATGLLLGLAAGVKLWPLLLVPVLLRPERWSRGTGGRTGDRRAVRWRLGWTIAGLLALAMTLPLLLGPASIESAGLVAYASHWFNNSALYLTLAALLQPIAIVTPLAGEHVHYLVRPLLVIGFLLALAWLIRTPASGPRQLLLRAFAAVAILFLLSPTQFPWYLAWLIAPAALALPLAGREARPLVAALLLYVATMPMYYLTYDHVGWVFAVHLPPTIAIMLALLWHRRCTTRMPKPPPTHGSTPSASSSPR